MSGPNLITNLFGCHWRVASGKWCKPHPQFHWRHASGAHVLMLLFVLSGVGLAEQAIIERPPFDRITLTVDSGGGVIEVLPLDLPDRVVPDPLPDGILTVRLLENPSTPYDVDWKNVEVIEFYEDLVVAQAQQLVAAGKLPEAFDYILLIAQKYPGRPELGPLRESFLQKSAATAYRDDQPERALAILAGLFESDPQFTGLARGVDATGEKCMTTFVGRRDLRSAREFLDRTEKQFPGLELSFIQKWRERFQSAAQERLIEAEQLIEAKDYDAARRAVEQARDIWPNSPDARRLILRINQLYPVLTVGVLERADPTVPPRLDAPAARRLASATTTPVVELLDYRSEGGEYGSPWGEVSFDIATRELTLKFNTQVLSPTGKLVTPYACAQQALDAVNPNSEQYDPSLAEVLESVRVEPLESVVFQLSRSHTKPAALLLGRSWPLGAQLATYELTAAAADRTTLKPRVSGPEPARALTIAEIPFADDLALVTALLRREIDIAATIPPWRLRDLAERSDIRVARYRLPRIHMLLLNVETPILAQREFRRALCYGTDRPRIVKEELLAGAEDPAFAVLSGPLPIGQDLSDAIGYAYNNQIKPRVYDPRLATILVTTAWSALAKKQHQAHLDSLPETEREKAAEPPALDARKLAESSPPLRLVHPADPIARVTCQTLAQQLEIVGVKVELVAATEAELITPTQPWDLRYAVVTMQEPLTDVRKLLGPGGIAGNCSDSVEDSLRKVDAAQNPREVSAALTALHKAAATDLPVIPLWQTSERFAYHAELENIPESVIELYQTAAEWRRQKSGGEQ